MAPRGVFGLPHGILSSTDEQIAFRIGIVALAAAIFYDGERNLRPVSGAAIVGIAVALFGSFIAPDPITNEWNSPVLVVLFVIGGVGVAYRRS